MKQFGAIVALIILALVLQGQGKLHGRRITPPVAPPGPPDSIEGTTQLAAVWFVDESELIHAERTTTWQRYSADNWTNRDGNADTVRLFALKNEVVSFQTVLVGPAFDVGGVEVWLDSLTGATYTIKNDSGRTYSDPNWYAGKPIEHFGVNFRGVGAGYRHPNDTSVYSTDWDQNQKAAEPADSISEGWLPDWLMPVNAIGSTFYDVDSMFQGGYPRKVLRNKNHIIATDIYVSRSAPAGEYTGSLRIYESSLLTHSIPVRLYVSAAAIPDTQFLKTNLIAGDPIFYYQAGKTKGSTGYWSLVDKMQRFFHRRNWTVQTAGEYHDSRVKMASYNMKYYAVPNTFFSTAQGYDGPGAGLGHNMYYIGVYGQPGTFAYTCAQLGSDTTTWGGNGIWPTGGYNIPYWADTADAWEQMFRDVSGGANSYPRRVIYATDEPPRVEDVSCGRPELGNIVGRVLLKDWTKPRRDATHNSLGVGSSLDWFCTTGWFDPIYHGIIDEASVAGFTDGIRGYTVSLEGWGEAYYTYDEWQADGRAGLYNWYGPTPQIPPFGRLDVPLTHGRAFFWLSYKYDVQHWWMWIASYTADLNNGDLGVRDPFFGSAYEGGNSGNSWDVFWVTKDIVLGYDFLGGGKEGIIGRMRSNAVRRGLQDYQILTVAARLGVNVAVVQDSLVGRMLNDYGDDSPPWPDEYTDRYRPPHWKQEGWQYDRWKRALADSIVARTGS